MESIRTPAGILALLFLTASCVQGDFVEPLESVTFLRSLTESQTRLPCRYKEAEGEKVVQVTWQKELPGGSKEQVITAHFTDGHTEFGRYSGRVKFESTNPTADSTLLIPITEDSDEGSYICHISTFPNGNFERRIALTVWTLPISSLDAVTLVEGQSYGVAASCRAVGRPVPRLSWDTELPGQSQNYTSEGGSVSSHFSLHPLRYMNGKKLDCLVWHPGLEKPRRISNKVEVQYPPDATISSSTDHWHVGLEKAELTCKGGGLPIPHNITWIRKGEHLPDGVSAIGGKLVFGRALRANDSGMYECIVKNTIGVGKFEYLIAITAEQKGLFQDVEKDKLILIIVGAAAGVVVLILIVVVVLVSRMYKKRTRHLKDQVDSFSRQASMRKINSEDFDMRSGNDLTVRTRSRHSLMSADHTYKGSQSTLGGRWGHPATDDLNRPVVWEDSRECLKAEREERKRRTESYVKSSNMSLDSGLPSSLVPVKPQQEEYVAPKEPDLNHLQERETPLEADWVSYNSADDEERSNQYLSSMLTHYFYEENGKLRPRPNGKAIVVHTREQII
ncbi:Nectin-4 [Oryzias melastigma]|uniref:Nectin-4 n=1 Tax=Oryzias melastigma TaxID=30732 RepID=A0A834EYH1_ORYME|nr:Nectin-4 [Oryzias melastigma]